jgi:VWFA-related protein
MFTKKKFGLTAVMTAIVFAMAFSVMSAQSGRPTADSVKKTTQRVSKPTTKPTPPIDDPDLIDDGGVIEVDTDLVTIPVKVTDRNGRFIPGLVKEDFTVTEDRQTQQIAYFSNEELPFTVALVLDMSYSSLFKIDEIQQAALQFITELRPNDRVMVVSFSEDVFVLTEPTSDRKSINRAIFQTSIGSGTSVYEAVDQVLNRSFAKIRGRKAIVLFTDGVDTSSRKVNERDNLRDALESEVIIYPIRYDTFADVQSIQNGKVRVNDPRTRPQSTPSIGGGSNPGSSRQRPGSLPSVTIGGGDRTRRSLPGDGTSREEYDLASKFLEDLAARTGGRINDARNGSTLARAFSRIASELREFYSIGYYPADVENKKKLRRIKVKVNRKKVSVRSRESYILRTAGENK